MWSRFVFISLFCIITMSYAASDETQNFNSSPKVSEEQSYDQFGSINTEKVPLDETTETPKNQKEQNEKSTEKKPNEKEIPKPSLSEESDKPSTPPRVQQNESLKNGDTEDRISEKEDSNKKKDEDEKVCFTHLGCFDMEEPWKSLLRPIASPNRPEEIKTKVHFYSRRNPQDPVYIEVYPKIDMKNANFDFTLKTVILVHGFGSTGNATWVKDMKDAYLKEVNANMMVVDWGEGAQHKNYLQVAGNTRVVGKELALLVRHLIENYKADLKKFHLIGHSLGAHICSYLAKEIRGIARLTALDPAQPGFEGFDERVRLDETDADFVDVVHTDAKPFIPTLGFGMITPQGHVDFYVNGGYAQPGCVLPEKQNITINGIGDLAKYTVEALSELVSCSHGKAHEYFVEALNKTDGCTFWGHKANPPNVIKSVTNTLTQGFLKKITALSSNCSKDDCIPLGFDTDKSPLRGCFVITTNKDKPYCIAENQEGTMSKIIKTVKENTMLLGKLL